MENESSRNTSRRKENINKIVVVIWFWEVEGTESSQNTGDCLWVFAFDPRSLKPDRNSYDFRNTHFLASDAKYMGLLHLDLRTIVYALWIEEQGALLNRRIQNCSCGRAKRTHILVCMWQVRGTQIDLFNLIPVKRGRISPTPHVFQGYLQNEFS